MSLYSFESLVKRKYGLVYTVKSNPDGSRTTQILVGRDTVYSAEEDFLGSIVGTVRDTLRSEYAEEARYPSNPLSATGAALYGETCRLAFESFALKNGHDRIVALLSVQAKEAYNRMVEAKLNGLDLAEVDLYMFVNELSGLYVGWRTGNQEVPKIPIGAASTITWNQALEYIANDRPIVNSVSLAGALTGIDKAIEAHITKFGVEITVNEDTLEVPGYLDVWSLIDSKPWSPIDLDVIRAKVDLYCNGATAATKTGPELEAQALARVMPRVEVYGAASPTNSVRSEDEERAMKAAVNYVLEFKGVDVSSKPLEVRDQIIYGPAGLAAFESLSVRRRKTLTRQVPSGKNNPADVITIISGPFIENGMEVGEAYMVAAAYIVRCKAQWALTRDYFKKKV